MTDNIKSSLLVNFVGNVFSIGLESRNDIDWCIVLSCCTACADCPTVNHDGGSIEAAHRNETAGLELETARRIKTMFLSQPGREMFASYHCP